MTTISSSQAPAAFIIGRRGRFRVGTASAGGSCRTRPRQRQPELMDRPAGEDAELAGTPTSERRGVSDEPRRIAFRGKASPIPPDRLSPPMHNPLPRQQFDHRRQRRSAATTGDEVTCIASRRQARAGRRLFPSALRRFQGIPSRRTAPRLPGGHRVEDGRRAPADFQGDMGQAGGGRKTAPATGSSQRMRFRQDDQRVVGIPDNGTRRPDLGSRTCLRDPGLRRLQAARSPVRLRSGPATGL